MISGEQFGYLEPCGCTKGQLGGLIRRYDLVEQLRAEKWPLALVDLGSLIKDPASARGGPEQTQDQVRHVALKALATMKYDALALSPEDLKLGVDEAVGQFLNMPGDRLKVVAANVVATRARGQDRPERPDQGRAGDASGSPPFSTPRRSRRSSDPVARPAPGQADRRDAPGRPGRPGEGHAMSRSCWSRVLPSWPGRLAKKYPAFRRRGRHLRTSGPSRRGREAQRRQDDPGQTSARRESTSAWSASFDDPKHAVPLPARALDPKLDGHARPMKAVIEDEFRDASRRTASSRTSPATTTSAAPGRPIVGAEACKTCHPNTFAKWATTKHAQAFESLLHDPKPNVVVRRRVRQLPHDGLRVHLGLEVAGHDRRISRETSARTATDPASKHAESPDNKSFRSAMHLTADLPTRTASASAATTRTTRPQLRLRRALGPDRPQGARRVHGPQGPQGPTRQGGAGNRPSTR